MNRSQKLLLPLALVAGAAVPALAVADGHRGARAADDCPRVLDREAVVTPALAEAPSGDPLREEALLTLTAEPADALLRVKLRQDGVKAAGGQERGKGRGRGRGRLAEVRVVEVAEGEYRFSVPRPEGGDVTFATDRVRSRPGKLSLRLRAAVADSEGDRVRSYRAIVQVRAYEQVCAADDDAEATTGTTTAEAPVQ